MAAPEVGEPGARQWTVLVFMNGDNNLEPYALQDFFEIAQVGSSDSVAVVVQLDRTPRWSTDNEDWSDTRRFYVTRNMEPDTINALPGFAREVDMASGPELRDFVTWGMAQYPAQKYAVIVWDHGQGWRGVDPDSLARSLKVAEALYFLDQRKSNRMLWSVEAAELVRPDQVFSTGFRSVSHDETSGKAMYNADIQGSLAALPIGKRIDVLGFDACLMAMIEAAYAFRSVAEIFVASEEVEPLEGWNYEDLLGRLNAQASMSPDSLGATIVASYAAEYGRSNRATTLSAIHLDSIARVASAVDSLARELEGLRRGGTASAIRQARLKCNNYGVTFTTLSVDLVCVSKALSQHLAGTAAARHALAVAEGVGRAVRRSYGDRYMTRIQVVSAGLAIYFPQDRQNFQRDRYGPLYRNGVTPFPVAFLDDYQWDEFVQAFVNQ